METEKNKTVLKFFITFTEFLLLLTIILNCNTVYGCMELGYGFHLGIIIAANVFAYLLILLWVVKDGSNKECIRAHKYLFLISVAFVLLFNAINVVNADGRGFFGNFLFFMNAMVVLFKIYRKNGNTFSFCYFLEHIILVLAVLSTLTWIGASVFELWGRESDIYVNWGGTYYDSNYLNVYIRRWFYNGDVTKNLGIFIEPPMFGLFLGLGLYTELFLKKKSNLWIVILFLIAIASNRATLAMMVSLLALFLKFLEIIEGKKHAKLLSVVSMILIAVGITGLFFYKKNSGGGSFATHLDDFAAALKCWTHYPLLGCGYNNEIPIRDYMSEFRLNNLGLSNSAAVVLAEGGIILFAYYIIPFILLMLSFFKRNKKLAYWGIGLCFMWIVVIFHTRLLIFFILALGYSMVDIRKKADGKIKLGIDWFDENLSDGKGYFSWSIEGLAPGIITMMGAGLFLSAAYGLIIKISQENVTLSIATGIVSIVLIIFEIAVLYINIRKKSLTKTVNIFIQLAAWFIYIVIGQPYIVLNDFLTRCHLRIQDNWWASILLIIGCFAAGLVADIRIKSTCNISEVKVDDEDEDNYG